MSTFSTSTESNPNDSDGSKQFPEEENATIEYEKNEELEVDDADGSFPFQRSKRPGKRERPKKTETSYDDRAQAKLAALTNAKEEAENAKTTFLSSTAADRADGTAAELHEKWNLSEQNLALAYSQAIKYTSRITKSKEATTTAEGLLQEWMDRFMVTFGRSLTWMEDDMSLNKKKMVRAIHKIVPILTTSSDDTSGSKSASLKDEDNESSSLSTIRIPPPTSKDYINLLRGYSMSKARRKGQQCEALMTNMMKLAQTVAFHYNEDDEKWTNMNIVHDVGMEYVASGNGSETKKWKLWVNESIPSSKAFALAIKCHAGSTHSESLEHIFLLNHIHDSFSESCQSHVPGIFQDDPYVLFHSIKGLKNLRKREERRSGEEWLRKLHKFVTSPENMDYFQEKASSKPLQFQSSHSPTIDVTPAYTTLIRLMAQLRGTDGVAADARKVLNRMHRVHNVSVNGQWNPDEPQTATDGNDETLENEDLGTLKIRKRIATIDIRANAYNLVLGLYRDSKSSECATDAVELLQRMVDASKEAPEDRRGVPLPTDQSFEFTIMSLANMSDGEKAIQEAERLTQLIQDQDHLESSVTAYNAFITVCNRQLFGKAELYDKALDILDKMNTSGISPNPETLALVMKACSLSEHNDHEKVLATSTRLFSQLEEQESSEKSALALTDRAYYYMMKCVDTHMVEDEGAKKDRIEELFSEACQRGLCSANVLSMFRGSVSEEDFRLTVGKGRLADHWIANIKGPRALYTDGTKGGAGKNARRKGKSTSDWVKNQKMKESHREARSKEKKVKRFFKKVKKMA
ncbi:hypothetical protein ACHAXR_012125 [Thalassiosira sp. AJA248-18]